VKKIGLIAGGGRLPILLSKEAKKNGTKIFAAALSEYTSPQLKNEVEEIKWLRVGEFEQIADFFKSCEISRAAMIGVVPQSLLLKRQDFDERINSLLSQLETKQTESVLGAIASELSREGIELIDSRKYFSAFLPQGGVLTDREPTERELRDIELGRKILRETSPLDIGQTVLIKNGVILAIEAIEGTDSCIRRGGILAKSGAVVVKMSKSQQDMRFDIPVVGARTLLLMRKVKAAVLAIEKKKVIFLDKEEAIGLANEAGISIIVCE
jgi:DUF1009 family protein